MAAVSRTLGQRPRRSAGHGTAGSAAPLEREGEYPLEDTHPLPGLVHSGCHGGAPVADDRDGRWSRLLRDRRRCRLRRDPLPGEAVSRRPARAARQSPQLLCFAFAGGRAQPGIRTLRELWHGGAGHEHRGRAVEAVRSALPALSRAGLIAGVVREPAGPDDGWRGRPVPRGTRQGNRADRLEDRPHGRSGTIWAPTASPATKETSARPTPRRWS
jgi:hypothetical protein